MNQLWAIIKSATFVSLVVFIGSLLGVGLLIKVVVERLSAGWGLPILALVSVLLLLGALLVFTTLIHLVGLSDPKSASAYRMGRSGPFSRWRCLVYSRSWRLQFSSTRLLMN
jgi:hypothetical protein